MISAVKVSDRWLLALVGVLLVASVLARYSGISHGGWNNVFQALAHPERFSQDIFIQGSGVVNSSLMFPLIRWLGLDFTDDVVGMALNLGLHAIAIGAFYGFVRALAPNLSVAESAVLVLLAVFLDNKVESVRAGLVVSGTLSPSWIGQCLIPVLLYLGARGRYGWAAVVSLIGVAMAFKVVWLAVMAIAIAAALAPEKRWKAGYFLLPVLFVVWQSRQASGYGAVGADDFLELTKLVIWRDKEECTLTLHPWPVWVLLAVSIPTYWMMAAAIDSAPLRRMARLVWLISIAACVWNEFYIAWGHEFFPRPVLVLVQPVRALSIYIMVYFTLLAVWVITRDWLTWYQKLAILLAVALFRVDSVGLAVFPPEHQALLVLVLGFAIPWVLGRADLGRQALDRIGGLTLPWLVCLSLSLVIAKHVWNSPSVAQFNRLGWEHNQRWTFRWQTDRQGWSAVQSLAEDVEDYQLMVMDGTSGKWTQSLPANEVALKAQFRGEPSHFAFSSLKMYREALLRSDLADALESQLNAGGPVSRQVLDGFAARDTRIMIGERALTQFPADIRVEKRLPGWVLLRP